MLFVGASFCALIQFALQYLLRRSSKFDMVYVTTLLGLSTLLIGNILLASNVSINICYHTEANPQQMRVVRPMKYVVVAFVAPGCGNLVMNLCKELRLVTGRFVALVVSLGFAAFVWLALAVVTASSQASFITCIVLSLVSNGIPSNGAKAAFESAIKCFDKKTQLIMQFLPIAGMLASAPLVIITCLGQAGVITWAEEEVAANAIITFAIILFLMLWNARDADVAAAQVELELKRVTVASAAADSANDAKRKFMR